jgi:acyl-CoA thioesterase-1
MQAVRKDSMVRRLAYSLSLLLVGVSFANAAQVVALGASNTAGRGQGAHPDGVPRSQAYPAQLQRLLNARGCHVKVLNAGKAGDTTRGMLARLPGAMGRDTKVVVFQQGGNDRRKGQSGSGANVAAIQNYVASHGAKMVTMGNLGSIAGAYRLPDGQHFSVQGHIAFAQSVLAEVKSALGC